MVSSSITTLSSDTSNTYYRNNDLRHVKGTSDSRFKGVLKQKNGHWGAQIYANNRTWLGTFHSEIEAAMAYDSASIKLGHRDRNFPWTTMTIQEPTFQKQFSTDEVFRMIKDGCYPSKFMEFLRSVEKGGNGRDAEHGKVEHSCTELFRKELTPSDVGKLNRLVIPKKCALRHFPSISEEAKENIDNGEDGVQMMEFFDRSMKLWQFRYCYWKSSQSFVFTTGWTRFVREKELKEKDEVIFYMCKHFEESNEIKTFCKIDVAYNDRLDSTGLLGEKVEIDIQREVMDCEKEDDLEEGQIVLQLAPKEVLPRGIRIFGVQMF